MLSQPSTDGTPRQALNQGGRPQGGRPGGGAPGRNGGGAAPGGVVGILHIIGGNDRGKSHPLTKGETSIGRGADQDCILADIAVSRRHVTILIEGPRYRMRDLGSGNGSLLNGQRTDTAILNDGDQIEIGNTLMRLEHAPSRSHSASAPMPGQGRSDAAAHTMMADAVSYPPPQQQPRTGGFPSAGPPINDPFAQPMQEPLQMPPPNRPMTSALPQPIHTGSHPSPGGGLLDTPVKKIAVFGTIFVVMLVPAVYLVKKFVGGPAKAQEMYLAGVKLYGEGEYDNAKKLFSEALTLTPDSPQTAKYLKQCDVELHAKGALKTAQGLATAKRWDEELKALDSIDKSSAAFEDAEKLKKTAVPNAVAAKLNDARDAMADDPEGAQAKVDAALALDPDNEEAQELDKKLKAGGKPGKDTRVAVKETRERPVKEEAAPRERPVKETRVAVVRERTPPPPPTVKDKKPKIIDDDDDELAAVPHEGGGAAGDVLAVKGAAGPYKAKDWNGAATAIRMAAKSEKGKNAEKTIALASQVTMLGGIYTKAEGDKARNASAALQGYQQAMAIDGRIGKGTHGGYFKGQISKIAQVAAVQAFQGQKWDVAYDNVKTAQKFGGSDGGVMGQLKSKANELNSKAASMQKSNLNGAKTLWRMVVKMVPATDPAYATAYKSLNTAAAHKDDDEE
ncbi:MAG: FHA domain-containing protein [Myxococcales bacterium]|nr:FHA domain-containing protein [Myxococcales bacterium]